MDGPGGSPQSLASLSGLNGGFTRVLTKSTFYIHWHTDGSVVRSGIRGQVTVIG